MRILLSMVLALLGLAGGSHVHAQAKPLPPGSTIVLLPRYDHGKFEPELVTALQQTCLKRGFTSVTRAQLPAALKGRTLSRPCSNTTDCDVIELMTALQAQAVVWYALNRKDDKAESFVAHMIRNDFGPGYEGTASQPITDKTLATVVPAVLVAALADAETKKTVEVTIDSRPSQLHVKIDQQDRTTPATLPLKPGAHSLYFVVDGSVVGSQTLEVPAGAATFHKTVEVEIPKAVTTSAPAAATPTSTPRPRGSSSTVPYVIAAGLAAVGVALLVDGIVTGLQVDQCAQHDPATKQCNRDYGGHATLYALVGAGAFMIGGGTLALVTHVQSKNNAQAMLRFQTKF